MARPEAEAPGMGNALAHGARQSSLPELGCVDAHDPEKEALVQDTKESSGVLSPAALHRSRSQPHRSQAAWTATVG